MRIISLHSFRPATGKTTIVASLAALIAQQGRRGPVGARGRGGWGRRRLGRNGRTESGRRAENREQGRGAEDAE